MDDWDTDRVLDKDFILQKHAEFVKREGLLWIETLADGVYVL